MNTINHSKDGYEQKYAGGYGHKYPESHIIRSFEYVFKHQLGLSETANGRMLDFGCGTGANLKYFETKGFEPHGVDIIESAILQCQALMPAHADNFVAIAPNQAIKDMFTGKFTFIMANQSLYYLPDRVLGETLSQMYDMLEENGIVLFTMIGPKSYYFRHVSHIVNDDFHEVILDNGRLKETTYINFTMDENHMLKRFSMFEKIQLGFYSSCIVEQDGSDFHYLFIGRKRTSA